MFSFFMPYDDFPGVDRVVFAEVSGLESLSGCHSRGRELGLCLRVASRSWETRVPVAAVLLSSFTAVGCGPIIHRQGYPSFLSHRVVRRAKYKNQKKYNAFKKLQESQHH